MATWNTTYNFNQYNGQSMNFGKAMLYGAFGQLTGMFGGGCFGGGYGMGMGSYGMGMGGSLFSMMGGFGGFGMYGCGIPDSYVGAQCGLAATNVLFSAIGTHLTSRREAKAAESAEVKAALETLGISADEFDSATAKSKAFKSEEYNNKIKSAANKAIVKLDYKGLTEPTEPTEPAKPADYDTNTSSKTTYDTAKSEYDKAKIQYDKDKAAYDEDKEKKEKHEQLISIAANPSSVTSKSVNSDLDATVIAAIKEKEDKEKEIDNAIIVVQNAKINANKKAYNKQLKREAIDNVKGSDGQDDSKKVAGKKLQDEFRAALKEYGNSRIEANKTKVKGKYDELKEFANENPGIISDGYFKTIDSAMKTYGLS